MTDSGQTLVVSSAYWSIDFFPKSQPLRTLDFLETAARSNTQILNSNTDVYFSAIADGRTRFLEEVNVRPSFRFSDFMFVHYTFSSVWVAEWPHFGK